MLQVKTINHNAEDISIGLSQVQIVPWRQSFHSDQYRIDRKPKLKPKYSNNRKHNRFWLLR